MRPYGVCLAINFFIKIMLRSSMRIHGGFKLGERASVPEILFYPLLRWRTAVSCLVFSLYYRLENYSFFPSVSFRSNLHISSDFFHQPYFVVFWTIDLSGLLFFFKKKKGPKLYFLLVWSLVLNWYQAISAPSFHSYLKWTALLPPATPNNLKLIDRWIGGYW